MKTIEKPVAIASVAWIPAADDGRRTGPPTAPVYASTCVFPLGGEEEIQPGWPMDVDAMFSILLEKVDGDPGGTGGTYEVGFLVPDLAVSYLHVGADVLVLEGPRPVATAVILERCENP